ncbi:MULTISPECIES: DEAD/DEAH box helicase [Enterococcus]|nr:DEAD/DEAH box helicase [Enterococcus lactis]
MISLLIKDERVILKFTERKLLEKYIRTPKFKIKLKRYVDQIQFEQIVFKNNLTVPIIKNIVILLKQQLSNIYIDLSVEKYVENKEFYIRSRYRVGNDIKQRKSTVIDNFNYFKSKVDSLLKRKLTYEQMWNAYYMCVMKNCSNFSVPGSGKTATVIGTYAFLREKKEIDKVVMIGPKNSFGSWIDEFRICFGIDLENKDFYLNIHSTELKDTKKRKYFLKFETGRKELILINYESVNMLKSELNHLIDEKSLLVFDEVHKIKNPNGQRAKASIEVSKGAGRILALTGTPIPNSYVDIYNVLNILYPEDYKDFFGFSIDGLRNPNGREIAVINEKLKPFFCRITKGQQAVPLPNEDNIEEISVSDIENRLFKIIYQTYKQNMFALMTRLLQLGSNPKLLLKDLDVSMYKAIIDDESDFSEDIKVKNYTEDIYNLVEKIEESSKTKATIELIKKLVSENKKTIVWCIFISSIELLENKCEELGLSAISIYGETSMDERLKLIKEFQKGQYDILITNPHTLAESVSLHQVCHDAIYYEYSFNLVHLLQSKDRIHRLGLADNQYTQYYYMQSKYIYNEQVYSLDDRIYHRLMEKEKIMLDAIDHDILEKVTSFEEDLKIIFQDF